MHIYLVLYLVPTVNPYSVMCTFRIKLDMQSPCIVVKFRHSYWDSRAVNTSTSTLYSCYRVKLLITAPTQQNNFGLHNTVMVFVTRNVPAVDWTRSSSSPALPPHPSQSQIYLSFFTWELRLAGWAARRSRYVSV